MSGLFAAKSSERLPSVSARVVSELGAQAVRASVEGSLPGAAVAPGAQLELAVRSTASGMAELVEASTGRLVSPCASVEIAERTKNFFT
jgi:hypothetical protein